MNERQLNLISIGLAILSAIFFAIERGRFTSIALVGSLIILIISLRSLWSGVLSLFPMLFAINPAPQALGAAELIFGLISVSVILGWCIRLFKEYKWSFIKNKGFIIFLIGVFFIIFNAYTANKNHVSLIDWLRGIAPFTYLIFIFPLIFFLKEVPTRVNYLGLSIAAYLALLVGHVVGYYFFYDVHDRVTMHLSRSTTILMAAGLSMSFVVAVRAEAKLTRVLAGVLASVCLMAILLTYTRSMLMAALAAILIFFIVLILFERVRLIRAFSMLLVILIVGIGTISYFGLENIWLNRISLAQDSMVASINNLDSSSKLSSEVNPSLDANLVSRLQEINLAIEHFKESPLLGKGFGIKNVVIYVGKDGPVETRVAYIHNWLFYFLMVGGIIGAVLYACLLICPVISNLSSIAVEHVSTSVARYGGMVFIAYGLFFAVFRHIDYNLLLATAVAISIVNLNSITSLKVNE